MQDYDLDGFFQSPEDGPAKWVLVFTAYLDESGQETPDWTFLAGFLGGENHWKEFVPKWRDALGPQRKFLHMSDLRWNRERTKLLLARLGKIPDECKLTPVLTGVRFKDYEDLVSGTPEEKTLKGYMACLVPLVLQILRIIPDGERLELVFEQQTRYQHNANQALYWLSIPDHPWKTMPDGRPKLAKWSFVPKGSTIMTDPADYFAFALREVWTDTKSKKAKWCQSILNSGDGEGIGAIMKRDMIRKVICETYMQAILEGVIPQWKGKRKGVF